MSEPVPGDVRRPRVVLGVGGGIAAYKVASLLRLFTESGHDVRVVPTRSALQFVGAPTWEALSGQPVATDVWSDVHEVPHVRLGQGADLVVVAPATADLLAKAAHGLADDLLTNTLLTARCPVVLAPAMHTEMWEHAATQANVETLRSRGVLVVEPAAGRLTGSDTGKGRLPEPDQLFAVCQDVLDAHDQDLAGRHVVVSAGGTREFLDPVRYLGNRSSGLQGIAIAQAAVARGATVTLVAANVGLPAPAGVDVVEVVTTAELHAAVVENPDILAGLVRDRGDARRPFIVGFAAETGDENASVAGHGRAKLERKGCELLVVNDVSEGKVFGREDTEAVILAADGSEVPVPPGSKSRLAHTLWDEIVRRAGRQNPSR